MPILHKIDEKLGIVLSTWIGIVSDADAVPAYRQLYEDKRWKPGFHEIVDLREADVSGVTSRGLRAVSGMVDDYTGEECEEFRTAVIAPKDLPFGVARIYQAISDETPERVRVFRDVKTALEWMNVDESFIR
jgi:hypothetical protein